MGLAQTNSPPASGAAHCTCQRKLHPNLDRPVSLSRFLVTGRAKAMARVEPPSPVVRRYDHQLHPVRAMRLRPGQQRHYERVCGPRVTEERMYPHGHEVRDRRVFTVRRARNQAPRDAVNFKDQRYAWLEPALPVRGGAGQLAGVSGPKCFRSIGERFETKRAEYRFIPKGGAAYIHAESTGTFDMMEH